MAEVYTCRCCGGNVLPSGDGKTGVCEYCGAKIVFPKGGIGRMNRANELRRRREFDQAEIIYRNLTDAFPDDPEVWWNILLCEYGIEYVEEENRRVITVNRMKYDSVFDRESYRKAIELADGQTREIYQKEAETIETIQTHLQEIAAKEEKYDVFISFKDKEDGTGERTLDSALAQEIYDALTKEGYKVFFSRITLRTAVGMEFEPKIFAALMSAPLMIVVACTPEHVNADWVKNEWSRYLKLMEKDAGKFLLPVYADMKPEELPSKLADLEGIEVNGANYMDLILSNVGRLIGGDKNKRIDKEIQENIEKIEKNEINFLLDCGHTAVRNQKWENAVRFFDEVLDINVDCAMAWWGKLTAATKDFSRKGDFREDPSCKYYYDQAMRCATKEEIDRFNADVERDKAVQEAYYREEMARKEAQRREEMARKEAQRREEMERRTAQRCEEMVRKLDKMTNNSSSFWYGDSEEVRKQNRQIDAMQDEILSIAVGPRKEELARQFEDYRWKREKVSELDVAYRREEEINRNLECRIKELQETVKDMQLKLTMADSNSSFGCLGIILVVISIILPPVWILVLIRCLIVRHKRNVVCDGSVRKFKKCLKEKTNLREQAYREGQQRIRELGPIYAEFSSKYKRVYSYVIPADRDTLLRDWAERLGRPAA